MQEETRAEQVRQRRELDKRETRRRKPDRLVLVLGGAFALALLLTAYLTFVTVREVVSTWNLTEGVPGLAISETDGGAGLEEGVPGLSGPISSSAQSVPELEPWDGASRVTLLVMGLDLRDWEVDQGAPRTDTMILLTIDPVTKTAGMLSIPRDLWVEIPGYGHGKINTAYQLGEGSQLPGGGPGLAAATVEQFMGVKIHFFAQIDFATFEKFIDEIRGVKIDVPEEIKIDKIGFPHPITLEAGVQTLYGADALGYVRARNSEGGDFDRAMRQQQVIIGIRHQLLQPGVQAHVLTNGIRIFQDLSSGVRTNLTFEDVFKLGLLAQQVDLENIQRGVIAPPTQVTIGTSPDGLSILKPITQEIRILRDEIFSSNVIAAPEILDAAPTELVEIEEARVGVYNGTAASGLAGTTQDYLLSQGINVIEVGNADLTNYTMIIDYTGNPYTVDYLMDIMNVQKTRFFNRFDPNSPVDVEVIIGSDWTVPVQ